MLGSRRYERCIVAQIHSFLVERRGTGTCHRIQRYEGVQIRRVCHHAPDTYLTVVRTHGEGNHIRLERVALDLRRCRPGRCAGGTLVDIQCHLRVHRMHIRQRTCSGACAERPAVRVCTIRIGCEGLLVRLGRIKHLARSGHRCRDPCAVPAKGTYIDIVGARCLQVLQMEGLTGHNRITQHVIGSVIRVVLNGIDADIRTEHFHFPQVGIRGTVPRQVNRMRCKTRLLQVICLNTRRVFELDVINNHIATHEQVTQTGCNGDIVIRQLVVREDETHFLEVRTIHEDGIERHKSIRVLYILHRTDIDNRRR